jgi:Cdc6-like AAA superfamily ATPase
MLNHNYRYQGPSAFTSAVRDTVFGRENDIKSIQNILTFSNQLVIYGKPGVGKSSILNASIIPFLNDRKNYIIHVNFLRDENPYQQILNLIQNKCKDDDELFYLDKISENEKSIWYYLKKQQFRNLKQSNEKLRCIFIFDQFEDLFRYKNDEILEFKKRFSELLNEKLPLKYASDFEKIENNLTVEELTWLFTPITVQFLFSINTDRFVLLNALTDYFPGILRFSYEIKPLSVDQAIAAIVNPAISDNKHFDSPPFNYTQEALDKMIDILSNNRMNSIEPSQLQIICRLIEEEVIKKNLTIVTIEHIPHQGDIYSTYYEKVIQGISDIPGDSDIEKVRIFIEDSLIFANRRIALDKNVCLQYVTESILEYLVQQGLLMAKKAAAERISYELSNDILIDPVLSSRKSRLEREAFALEEKKRKILDNVFSFTGKNRKKIKSRAIILLVGILVFIAGLALIIMLILFPMKSSDATLGVVVYAAFTMFLSELLIIFSGITLFRISMKTSKFLKNISEKFIEAMYK